MEPIIDPTLLFIGSIIALAVWIPLGKWLERLSFRDLEIERLRQKLERLERIRRSAEYRERELKKLIRQKEAEAFKARYMKESSISGRP